MNKEAGLTFIEIVIVVMIIAILTSIAVIRYVDLTPSASNSAKNVTQSSAQSAWSIYVTQNKTYPTVSQLASLVQGSTATNSGIQVNINGTLHTIATFIDINCSTPTSALTGTNGTVACVGNISP